MRGKTHNAPRNQWGGNRSGHQVGNDTKIILQGINLKAPASDLFDKQADEAAKTVAENAVGLKKQPKDVNKSTQLRRFYDEIIMWDKKIRRNPEKFPEMVPMIRMLNAKVAYANGRELVDRNYVDLMRHCLQQVDGNDPKTFHNFKLFMEAFTGFYKMYKPR